MMESFSERAFAAVSDGVYFSGLRALLNSLFVYHGREAPVFVFDHGFTEGQREELSRHPLFPEVIPAAELAHPAPGTWEAKQQVFAHLLPRARLVYLLDADLVLTSRVDDVFALAAEGKIISSRDGPRGVDYSFAYGAYSPALPGLRAPYINSGALCLDVRRHWDLAGLWAFAARYGAYSPGRGEPLCLPGHGDQGVFNALCAMLGKTAFYHELPEAEWCDSGLHCPVRITREGPEGVLEVVNEHTGGRQRLVHCTGPKWWTPEGRAHQERFGDKLRVFRHFETLFEKAEANRAVEDSGQTPVLRTA